MKNNRIDTVKLGIFVLIGIGLLIFTLYVIGKNKGMFSDSFEIKTRFRTVSGLVTGNNVRFAGIDIGAVKNIQFIHDTVIEVTMNVSAHMRNIIRINAVANLGSDGLIGNRVVNIMPVRGDAPLIKPGDLLPSKEEVNSDAMVQTLYHTNENIAIISEDLRATVHRINTSAQLSQLLDDRSLTANLKASLIHLHETTEKASGFMTDVTETLALASHGKGTLATVLTDTTLAIEIGNIVKTVRNIGADAERLTKDLDRIATGVETDFRQGKGSVQALLKDSLMTESLRNSMTNIQTGTAAFQQNMEALKHNFLFRRYYKKMEKQKKQNSNANTPSAVPLPGSLY